MHRAVTGAAQSSPGLLWRSRTVELGCFWVPSGQLDALPEASCSTGPLCAELARALVPRSVTVALLLPTAAQLPMPAGVCLTGLSGASFV